MIKWLPDILALIGIIGIGYGLWGINQNIAYTVVGGILFLLGLWGGKK